MSGGMRINPPIEIISIELGLVCDFCKSFLVVLSLNSWRVLKYANCFMIYFVLVHSCYYCSQFKSFVYYNLVYRWNDSEKIIRRLFRRNVVQLPYIKIYLDNVQDRVVRRLKL